VAGLLEAGITHQEVILAVLLLVVEAEVLQVVEDPQEGGNNEND